MKYFIITILFLSYLLLELFIFPFPFVLLFLLFVSILLEESWIFFLGIIAGVFLDSMLFHPLGLSSLFFILLIAALFAYKRKFQVQSTGFIMIASLLAIVVFDLLFAQQNIFQGILIGLVVSYLYSLVLHRFGNGILHQRNSFGTI